MEETKKEKIQYRFTAYVSVALKRARKDYICRAMKISGHERSIEELIVEPSLGRMEENPFSWEEADQVPLMPDAVRQYLENQVGESGKAALASLTDAEILVVFMKVFKQMTYAQIGGHLNMDWKKAGSIFTYAKQKLKKGWKKPNGV